MESHHEHHSTRFEKSYIKSMNLSYQEDKLRQNSVATISPGQVLLHELFWQFKQRECLALKKELQHQSCHATLRCQRHFNPPSLLALMPASECRQIERLCGRIPTSHVWAVLFRFREILAHNAVLPWELVYIFKQVLKDFLSEQEEVGYKCPNPSPMSLPVSPPPGDINSQKSSTVWPLHDRQDKQRQEIPTISSYVDKHLHNVGSYTVQRASLPFCNSSH